MSVPTVHRQYPWYQRLNIVHFPQATAADFNGSMLMQSVGGASSDYLLVEFYMPWCPFCQHFAPQYERLALAIQEYNKSAPGRGTPTILPATIDCVAYETTCVAMNIKSYPTVLLGTKQDWLSGNASKLTKVEMNSNNTAEVASAWINQRLSLHLDVSHFSLADVMKLYRPHSDGESLAIQATPLDKVDLWDVQVATAQFLHIAMTVISGAKEDRNVLVNTLLDFLTTLSLRFPEPAPGRSTCRTSLADLKGLVEKSRNESWSPDRMETTWKLCGKDWMEYGNRGWRMCRGTWPGKRGFTCGLWSLFHAVAARAQQGSVRTELLSVREAIIKFFNCAPCRDHFAKLPLESADAVDRRSVQLWWWKAHNNVNDRVKRLEQEFMDGDPAFPKVQWPTQEQCPACRDASASASFLTPRRDELSLDMTGFDTNKTVEFLSHYYGES